MDLNSLMLLKNNTISRISKLTIKFEFNDMDLMKIIVRGSNPKIIIYKNLNETLLIYLTKIYIYIYIYESSHVTTRGRL
jgi:hypothetical protein